VTAKGGEKTGEVLRAAGLTGVYIAVIPHKEQRPAPVRCGARGREKALSLAKDCLREAADQGVPEVLVQLRRDTGR
jgi:hypothetical protein